MAPRIAVQIDGMMVVAGLAVVGVGLIYFNREKFAALAKGAGNLVNPASSSNLINQGATAVVGEENLGGFFDYLFGAVDLLTYINSGYKTETFGYAQDIYGVQLEFGQ